MVLYLTCQVWATFTQSLLLLASRKQLKIDFLKSLLCLISSPGKGSSSDLPSVGPKNDFNDSSHLFRNIFLLPYLWYRKKRFFIFGLFRSKSYQICPKNAPTKFHISRRHEKGSVRALKKKLSSHQNGRAYSTQFCVSWLLLLQDPDRNAVCFETIFWHSPSLLFSLFFVFFETINL